MSIIIIILITIIIEKRKQNFKLLTPSKSIFTAVFRFHFLIPNLDMFLHFWEIIFTGQ